MTNCKNCGAPLHTGKCEYCGTTYGFSGSQKILLDSSVLLDVLTPNEARRYSIDYNYRLTSVNSKGQVIGR